jgi:beta-phosphoglucomutase-like phosphatase (HAD superfamily)
MLYMKTKGNPMADVLTQYLHHTRNEGKVPSESGFEKFKAGSQEERTTHPLAHHPKYVNLDGTPYTLGGETLQDRYDRLERQKQAEAYNKEHAHPVPGAYALSEDTPEKRAAQAAHTAQIAAGIRESERES